MQAIGIGALQEGDILLMMGEGPLSDLIAWASDGVYSHAAIVAGDGELIEASLGGVRRYPLERRLAESEHFHFIDAWRPHDGHGQPFGAGELALVGGHAATMLGLPYPVDQLALLGVVMAVRGKWPEHALLRRLVRIALDHALPARSPGMVCSEVVYRAWAECAVEPRGRIAPAIVAGKRGSAVLPPIDWKRLLEEFGPLLFPKQAGRLRAAGELDPAALARDPDAPTDDALEQARQEVLSRLGHAGLMRTAAPGALARHQPNPRLVSPQDLANSPATVCIGRLLERQPQPPRHVPARMGADLAG